MILFYKNGNTLKIHNPSAETKHYQMPSVNSVLATEDDLTKVTTVSSAIKQPVILTPANNSTGFNGDITFTGFETIETFTGTLDAISIAIATDINFANVVVLQRVETTDASSFNIAVDLSSSDLYIKVKYHSDLYSSVWSNVVKTTTPEYIINKPTIIGPTNGQTGVALFPMISGSDFTYVGVGETHESTTYQIAKDVAFTNIAYNVTSTTDLTSHLITEDLDYETTYYIRMRYNGSKYGNSEWSNTITITTLDIESKVALYTSDTGSITIFKTIEIDGFIYGVGGVGPISKRQPIIVKLDSDLNIISYKILPAVATTTIFYEVQYYNNNLYVCGNNTNLYKMDLNLNFINHVSVNSNIYRYFSLTILNDFIYAIGSGMDSTNGVVYLSKFDMNFNLIKTISLGILFSESYYQYIDTNGTDLFLSYTLYDVPSQRNYFVIAKMDTNLNPIKRVYYPSTSLSEIRGVKVINGEVYCIAVSNNSFYILKHDINLVLIKSTRVANFGFYLDTIVGFNDLLIISGFGSANGSPLFIFDKNLNKINLFVVNNLDNIEYNEVGRCFGNYKNKSLMYCGGMQTNTTTFKGLVGLLDVTDDWLYSSNSLEITENLDNNIIISTVGENITQFVENSTIKNMGILATSKNIPTTFVSSVFTKEQFII